MERHRRQNGVPRTLSIRTADLDEVRHVVGTHFYANFTNLVQPASKVSAAFDVMSIGPLTVGDLRCGADVQMRFGELGAYHVDIPLSGRLVWQQGGDELRLATPRAAAVFQPVGDTCLDRWYGDCRILAIKIDRVALEARLAAMLDHTVRTPLRLDPSMDVSQGPGRTWARLVRLLATEARQDNGLASHPLLADRLWETVLDGLLLAADHELSDQLRQATGVGAPPRAVKRAVDAIHAHPDWPFTIARLADLAGVSERRLQEGFQRHVGMAPLRYLRDVRLARVHEELCETDWRQVTVAEVASRWGFTHLGRFAAMYRARYGVSPSQVLRG